MVDTGSNYSAADSDKSATGKGKKLSRNSSVGAVSIENSLTSLLAASFDEYEETLMNDGGGDLDIPGSPTKSKDQGVYGNH